MLILFRTKSSKRCHQGLLLAARNPECWLSQESLLSRGIRACDSGQGPEYSGSFGEPHCRAILRDTTARHTAITNHMCNVTSLASFNSPENCVRYNSKHLSHMPVASKVAYMTASKRDFGQEIHRHAPCQHSAKYRVCLSVAPLYY